jgi:uncharacterized repeat protein (TIGR03843 family)
VGAGRVPPQESDAGRQTGGSGGAERPLAAVDPARAHALLAGGEVEVLGRFPWASNATLLARVTLDDLAWLAVYKPERGERPLWDFPPGLYRREVAAWLVSEAAGWGLVPLTLERDGPLGHGSLQLFVDCREDVTAFDLLEEGHQSMRTIAAFDVVANNADRKAGHTLLDAGGRVWAIDHGVCFHDEPKLRTVIWDFAAEPLPEPLVADLGRLCGRLRGGELAARLEELLSPVELRALRARAERLAERAVFPEPEGGRPYPWPLV